MTERDVLTEILNLQKSGIFEGNKYIVELQDSKEWGNVFSRLEKNNNLDKLEEYSTLDEFVYQYVDGEGGDVFTISLLSSLDDDRYSLTIEKE